MTFATPSDRTAATAGTVAFQHIFGRNIRVRFGEGRADRIPRDGLRVEASVDGSNDPRPRLDGHTDRQLVVFTHSFPFGHGETFLETEAPYLAARFPRVVFVPRRVRGVPRPVPTGSEIDTSLAEAHRAARSRTRFAWMCVRSGCLYREVASQPSRFVRGGVLRAAADFLVNAMRARDWLRERMAARYAVESTIFYSYWVQPETLGIALATAGRPQRVAVARAHGGDLYESRSPTGYLPFRRQILDGLDAVFVVSEHGRRYLASRYPAYSSKIEVARLGVEDPGFTARPSGDGKFRLVSCSALVPVKRVSLLIDALPIVAEKNPAVVFEWHHLGDGPLRAELEAHARATLPERVQWRFHGQLARSAVIDFYRTHPVDVFVNVSASEGIPVSIMEAQSCGIPVIATGVGGTPEIVDALNGVLLADTPAPRDVAAAITKFVEGGPEVNAMRRSGSETWGERYNAGVNYRRFVERLEALAHG